VGLLADVFVSSREDAFLYEDCPESDKEPQGGRFVRVEYTGLTTLEFGTLWAIIEGAEWEVERHMLRNLAHTEEGGTWLEEFPQELVRLLAALDTQLILPISTAWGETEELNCPGEELAPIVTELKHLAGLALNREKGMFLWGSL
jgi:hypothetical protein